MHVGKRQLDAGKTCDSNGQLRLRCGTPKWTELVTLAVAEVRRFGAGRRQVARRFQAMLDRAARKPNESSDSYVLLTVLFASVLFFGGIGGTFQSRRLRLAAFVLAALLFLIVVIVLGTMPICRE